MNREKPLFSSHNFPSLQTRLLLFWTHRSQAQFTKLSMNVIREAVSYLPRPSVTILPSLHSNYLRIFSLINGTTIKAFLSSPFQQDTVLCTVDDLLVIALGAKPATSKVSSISLCDFVVREERGMKQARSCPAACRLSPFLYVFGGRTTQSSKMTSAEKFCLTDRMWTSLPDMGEARSNFHPLVHKDAIYLLDTSRLKGAFEVFNPCLDTFHILPITFDGFSNTSLAAISEEGELIVITSDGDFGRFSLENLLNPETGKSQKAPSLLLSSLQFRATSPSPPILLGQTLYWIEPLLGNLLTFSLDSFEHTRLIE